jgi:hypothetical protein
MFCFEQKIATSRRSFCHQRQKQSLLGSLMRADISRFVSFATFCENCFWENHGAPGDDECDSLGGRALPLS